MWHAIIIIVNIIIMSVHAYITLFLFFGQDIFEHI